jgi:hypothetical protein
MAIRRRIVENYPASRLPRDLLGSIDPSHWVRVMIEDEVPPPADHRSFRQYFGAAKNRKTTTDEAVGRIRNLRDEWSS